MKDISFKIHTLGCKVNQYDSQTLSALLKQQNYIEKDKNVDLVIVNSCAVTLSAISKSRRVINNLKKENPKAKLVLMGCWPETHSLADDLADLIVGVGNLNILVNKINNLFSRINLKVSKLNLVSNDKTRYFIKIQDGCNQFCSYCIIPYSRGRLQSRKESDVIQEIKQAISLGYQEIVLTGIHLGLYGKDLKSAKANLFSLLFKINNLDGNFRIRLSSIEVNEINDDIISLMSENDTKICPHLHISLQSGSDKILKSMNRPYSKQYFRQTVEKLREKIPDIAISTDIIVGFPGESDEDFQETLEFSRQINFSKIHVFSFSAHKKTPAYNLDNKVDFKVIKDRSKKLRNLSSKLEKDYYQKMKNKDLQMIVEKVDDNYIYGHSQYYFKFKINKKKLKSKERGRRLLGNLFSA